MDVVQWVAFDSRCYLKDNPMTIKQLCGNSELSIFSDLEKSCRVIGCMVQEMKSSVAVTH